MDAEALIEDLDADQRAAVTVPSHLVAVIAGAGSGKTRVLTRRIAHRIATGSADARHTLALTFTREAAGELRRRLRRLGLTDPVEAGTFHSVMLGVLRQRRADTDRPPVNVLADRRRLLRDAMSSARGRRVDDVLAEVDWAGARGLTAADYPSAARAAGRRPPTGVDGIAEVLASYATEKRRRGVVDFDDVLAETLRELRRDNGFADATRWRFRHLLVDEAQDLNPLQHGLIDVLRHGRDDLFLVGDPAQAIYGFNGADPSLLIEVDDRFPGIEVVRLPRNHRCTPQIVDAGVHVLRRGGPVEALASERGDGPAVEEIVADDEADEATRIARLLSRHDPHVVRSGQAAVLARTHAQLRPLADTLRRAGIPVRTGRTADSPIDAAVRTAAYNGSAGRLRAWAHDTLEADIALEPDDGTAPDPPGRAAAEPERRVAAAVLDFLRERPHGDGAGFRSWVATTNPFDDPDDGGVELLTFHAAKGREWHLVIVSGVESSLVPHRSATTATERAEEARLLYVAMTRATDQLVLTRAARRGGYRRAPSPFVEGLELGERPAAAPPSRTVRRRPDAVLAALHRWRDDAARRNGVLPVQLMSDRDLASIAAARPRTAEELQDASSVGPITARRLAPELAAVIERAAGEPGSTGAASRSG